MNNKNQIRTNASAYSCKRISMRDENTKSFFVHLKSIEELYILCFLNLLKAIQTGTCLQNFLNNFKVLTSILYILLPC